MELFGDGTTYEGSKLDKKIRYKTEYILDFLTYLEMWYLTKGKSYEKPITKNETILRETPQTLLRSRLATDDLGVCGDIVKVLEEIGWIETKHIVNEKRPTTNILCIGVKKNVLNHNNR